jgi:hypothetical protein
MNILDSKDITDKVTDQLDEAIENSGCPIIDELNVPEFEPIIPHHLLDGKNPSQKWIMERLSVIMQQNKWQSGAIHDVHNYARYVNGKVAELEKFRLTELNKQDAANKSKKFKKWLVIIGALIVYPIYLQSIDGAGIESILRFLRLGP